MVKEKLGIFEEARIKTLDINQACKEAGAIRFDKGSASFNIFDKNQQDFLSWTSLGNLGSYPPEEGTDEILTLIQGIEKGTNNTSVQKDEICLTNGAIHALRFALGSLLRKRDKVIVNNLSFEGFSAEIEGLGLLPVRVNLRNNDELEKAIKEHQPKAMVINSPENPSGAIYGENLLKSLNETAERNGLLVISDEVNNQIVYPPYQFISPSRFISRDRLIIVNSFSKNYFLPGIRLGWVIANADISRKIKNRLSVSQVAIGGPSQAIACLVVPKYQDRIDAFKAALYRRKIMGERILNELGLKFLNPVQGGSTYFVEIGEDSERFQKYLLAKYNIGVTPGTYFGEEWKNWIRVGFSSVTDEEMEENLPTLKQALSS